MKGTDFKIPSSFFGHMDSMGGTDLPGSCRGTSRPLPVAESTGSYSASMTGMSMLRFLEEKLMPISVTGRLPPFHLSA